MVHEQPCLWGNCQSPAAHSCDLLNYPSSFCRGMFKLNSKFDADYCSTCSIILNVTATQYTCSLSGIYCPPLTSAGKLSVFMPPHSSPFPSLHGCHANHSRYINNVWTLLRQTIIYNLLYIWPLKTNSTIHIYFVIKNLLVLGEITLFKKSI